MTYIIQSGSRRTFSARILTIVVVGFVLIVLQASTTQAQWATSGTNISNTNTGNVGIGTNTPAQSLHVQKDQNLETNILSQNANAGALAQANVRVKNNIGTLGQLGVYSSGHTAYGALGAGDVHLYSSSNLVVMSDNANGVLKFAAGGNTEKMRITSAGYVGIGTAAPSYSLDVNGGTNGFRAKAASSSSNDTIATFESASGIQAIVRANGNVGIGTTSPSQKVEAYSASGPTYFKATSGSVGTYLGTDGTNSYLQAVAASQKIFISNSAATALLTADTGTGNVGIGTTSPSKKLDVVGDINATGVITGGTIQAKYQDVAEWVESSQTLAAGTVVVLDQTKSNQVIASSQAYDTRVAGVISLQPGITLGESGANKVLVATTGRVRVKVDASRAPIRIGDLLVTSDTAGLAMKSQPITISRRQIHSPGTLIGKALEPLEKGTGEILVLLSLQ